MTTNGGHQLPNKVFPVPYQVDFTVEAKGRHLDSTKRKLIWKFGFADPPAVFPQLHDANENIIGDNSNTNNNTDGSIVPYSENTKKGVECRGREHEIMLTWSLITSKVHIYVDSREIYRHEPIKDDIKLNPWSSQFHRGFDLPNPEFNGKHRIDIRCYARTPMGAKNMVVDANGGRFRQYDLTVDGLSYFSFPAMFELGTDRMWAKVSRWGLDRTESQEEESYRGGGTHGEHHGRGSGGFDQQTGRSEDEYHFDKANRKSGASARNRYGSSLTKNEYRAMNPRTESEEERMVRIAQEASLKDWEKEDVGRHNKQSNTSLRAGSSSSEENNSDSGNRKKDRKRSGRKKSTKKMTAIGEDNLIDFGADDAAQGISQISITRQASSNVSVLADDDATTASFVINTAWGSNGVQQQPPMPPVYNNQQQPRYQQQPPPQYHDPTFQIPYAQQQQPPSYVGSVSSASPRIGMGLPSDASFAVAPPPTWDDYNQAFGGSTTNMGASVVGGGSMMMINPMSPTSSASVGVMSPMAQQQPAPAMQYGMQQQQQQMAPQRQLAPQWQSQTFGPGSIPSPASQAASANKFDPMRADPFAS